MTPVVATLEMALPEMEPNRAEAITDTLAEPPRRRPIPAVARSMKNSPQPELTSKRPKKINKMTMTAATLIGVPSAALVSKARYGISSASVLERPVSGAGTRWPTRA